MEDQEDSYNILCADHGNAPALNVIMNQLSRTGTGSVIHSMIMEARILEAVLLLQQFELLGLHRRTSSSSSGTQTGRGLSNVRLPVGTTLGRVTLWNHVGAEEKQTSDEEHSDTEPPSQSGPNAPSDETPQGPAASKVGEEESGDKWGDPEAPTTKDGKESQKDG